VGLSASFASAAAAGHDLEPLDLVPEILVVGGVGQEDYTVRAGVGVGVLTVLCGPEYARLGDVHEAPPRGPGSGVRHTPAGPFLFDTIIISNIY
jgi:hypothetical protein